MEISSSASPEPSEKEHGSVVGNNGQDPVKSNQDTNPGEAEATKELGFNSESQNAMPQFDKRGRKAAKRIAFSDSDFESDGDLSMANMVKLVEEKRKTLEDQTNED
ncbi:hypothetical protein ES332_D04G010300v1 [Gossypium tomentosum]|uniref:Uncharacterized protein n=1 Tax=Gossypium tomentosum TaxID=34277 RepID=A0A5D2LAW8_GOSTO|nr:hypothetical protein ES332_D04G010300v1 [Gossypium tomentosum]